MVLWGSLNGPLTASHSLKQLLLYIIIHGPTLTVVQRVDGVNHELEEPMSEVAAWMQHRDSGAPASGSAGALSRHHRPRHGRAGHASLQSSADIN